MGEISRNIGKNTIGDTGKMKVKINGYERSTHNLSTIFRNSQAPGTIVPFLKLVGLTGDTFDIDMQANVMTHPTVGPLFGSFKLQCDIFTVPIRLYNQWLHNNRAGIGLDMGKVKLPQLQVNIKDVDTPSKDNQFSQIHPSSILSYLGLKGYGVNNTATPITTFRNALPILGYYDICKNYYFNKQEPKFYTIGAGVSITGININGVDKNLTDINTALVVGDVITIYPNVGTVNLNADVIILSSGGSSPVQQIKLESISTKTETVLASIYTVTKSGPDEKSQYLLKKIYGNDEVNLEKFNLDEVDNMRDVLLGWPGNTPFNITENNPNPLLSRLAARGQNGHLLTSNNQFGLCLRTYNSDLFNNWINTEWIEGENGINSITAINTAEGSFTIDTLIMSKKVYNMLNKIAISGGTYKDWLETMYDTTYIERSETPIFEGGMSQEIVFQEVISNSATADEPLGSLAGRGTLHGKQKGGKVTVKLDEICYVMGLVSIVPRIDYSQGNDFDTLLTSVNDFHKPALDQIGFQDLITDGMAWSDTKVSDIGKLTLRSVGKQPAWINYMTNVNRTYGNFALNNNEAFMVLNRNYSTNEAGDITDLTTYVNPSKFNYIFADTRLDAQNFWVQIGLDIKCRRKMSAKSIPNL